MLRQIHKHGKEERRAGAWERFKTFWLLEQWSTMMVLSPWPVPTSSYPLQSSMWSLQRVMQCRVCFKLRILNCAQHSCFAYDWHTSWASWYGLKESNPIGRLHKSPMWRDFITSIFNKLYEIWKAQGDELNWPCQ